MPQAIRLFHRRWSVPVIAVLAGGPLRYTALAGRLKRASRDTLAETLRHLVTQGAVEHVALGDAFVYQLSETGQALAAVATELTDVIPAAGLLEIALKKWPMLVLVACAHGATRYSELHAALPGITPRALSDALSDLISEALVEHRRGPLALIPERYAVAPRAEPILPALKGLVEACASLPRPRVRP